MFNTVSNKPLKGLTGFPVVKKRAMMLEKHIRENKVFLICVMRRKKLK